MHRRLAISLLLIPPCATPHFAGILLDGGAPSVRLALFARRSAGRRRRCELVASSTAVTRGRRRAVSSGSGDVSRDLVGLVNRCLIAASARWHTATSGSTLSSLADVDQVKRDCAKMPYPRRSRIRGG